MKTTLGVFAGIIVGAIGMELLNKTNPQLVAEIEGKIKDSVNSIKNSVKKDETVEEAGAEQA
ncbi:MAG TPA: hypothetical protein HPP54_06360 [Nitrospinae bacterium]|nr:hypothetical protein [Nitrospinota bacterium]